MQWPYHSRTWLKGGDLIDFGAECGLRACVGLGLNLVVCGAGNGALPPAAQPKQAAQPNGRPVAGQQWQPPQSPPAPSAKPVLQDLPATESVKMSSELRVSLLLLLQWCQHQCCPQRLPPCPAGTRCPMYATASAESQHLSLRRPILDYVACA